MNLKAHLHPARLVGISCFARLVGISCCNTLTEFLQRAKTGSKSLQPIFQEKSRLNFGRSCISHSISSFLSPYLITRAVLVQNVNLLKMSFHP